jgi:DMSO/TMAO reductase YedYZ molybdopterin-dependent catalytic subunit
MASASETGLGRLSSLQELQLSTRNHGTPLEALKYDVTPVGLHYLLTHFDIPVVNAATWRLRIGGRVHKELELSLDDIRRSPVVRSRVTMECAGNGRARLEPRPASQPWVLEAVGTGEWGGTPLRPLLEEAGPLDDAVEVLFGGLDRGFDGGVEQSFERSLSLDEALRDEVLLAYELNGTQLPPQHGFPLRLVVPGWYGMTNVKWLERITLLDKPFEGYQQRKSYRVRQQEDDEGDPLTRMAPRALMVPPGIPDFLTRERVVELGPCRLEGRAWSGWGPIAGVDVSDDGGETWSAATLGRADSRWSWTPWTFDWEPGSPGKYELLSRTRDESGNEQPVDPPWNLGGYANNAVQRVVVTVRN